MELAKKRKTKKKHYRIDHILQNNINRIFPNTIEQTNSLEIVNETRPNRIRYEMFCAQ